MDKGAYESRRHLLEIGGIGIPSGRREKYAAMRALRGLWATDPTETFKDPKLQQLAGSWDITPDQVRKALGSWDTRQTTLRSLMSGHSTHHLGSMSSEGGRFLQHASDKALYDLHGYMRGGFGYSTGNEDAALRSQNDFAHTGANPGGEKGASAVSSHRSNKNGLRVKPATPDETGRELFDRYKPVAQQNLDDYNFAQSSPPAQADTAAINKVGRELGIGDDVVANQGSLSLGDIKKIRTRLEGITTPADGAKWWNGLTPAQRRVLKASGLAIGATTVSALLDAGDLYAGTQQAQSKNDQQKKDGIVKGLGGAAGLTSLIPAAAPVAAPVAMGLGAGQIASEVAKSNRVHNPNATSNNKNGHRYQLDSTYQHTAEKPVTVQPYKPYVKPKPKYQQNREKQRRLRRK